ncbi:cdc42 effector protein 2 [Erpetoichthys calabaricus]|uniref:cdc42 effector protein 2 n=1 Tax=Erpetoichthys calabaricus TaxID=27687 RepID=UPI0010A08998|nr:cdc42 effector protein 2 [Erpetoichthys calabaricus]
MPAKTPIYLKTNTPKKGKKLKLRDVLSGDMISPPMGDFRHSAHIGPDGERDMFGDVAFLQGKLDLLPSLNRHSFNKVVTQSAETGQLDHLITDKNGVFHHHPQQHSTLLKSTVSLPSFVQDQAPPKPPRLHLEEAHGQRSMSVSSESGHYYSGEEMIYSASIPAFRHLVASSCSFSEASSEDSMMDGCQPLDPRRGLSLDSDAGLSNEDLVSENSESLGIPKSESLFGLDLDLGPSILEDVLRIMDEYKTQDVHYEI